MIKKVGIAVAAASVALLAVTPLAFADDGGSHRQSGLLNVQDTSAQVPVQLCNNSIAEGVLGVLSFGQKNKDSHDGDCHQKNKAGSDD
ncbi:MAG TPA: hypothetical protein VK735_21955 [Pseudonocardia sp.]|uniref:hypothetical protein n=1 Tax=Pseudonocardia sp. TaxID=60912 RepID=UPI002C524F3E|nr:hypothetical protein [Pseudonocardia sp.]HTF50114.1 hypothetical protein [Pseudonocardia sp.]